MQTPLRRSAAGPVLATAIAGAVLVADPTFAAATGRTPGAATSASSGVSAALEIGDATAWYTSGQFVVRNTGSVPAPWALRFRATGGTFSSWADWTSDTEQDGDLVTITAKPGQELAPGATANLSFGMSGDGSVVPTISECSIDGGAVSACSPADGGTPDPEPGPDPDPEPPAEDTEAPGAVPDVSASALDAHTVRVQWAGATDDRGVDGYTIARDGSAPVRVGADARDARLGDLAPGSRHRFTIAAVDAAGNVGPGTPVEVATPAVPTPVQRLVVERTHSIVPVRARGDAERARMAEGRRFRHSAHEPTGRFVTAGEQVTVTVPDGVSGLVARFGMFGVHAGLNGGEDVGTTEVALQPGTHTVTAPLSGSLQIRDTAPEASRTTTVRVDGGRAMAVAVEGETSEAQWAERMRTSDAPIVELVGSNVLVQVQKHLAQRHLLDAGIEVNPRIRMMERVIDRTDALFGLDRAGIGTAHRADQRILITNPDSGPGQASATHDRLSFHNQHGAMQALLTGRPSDKWALWHEVGHTYQPDWMLWAGLNEVTVNIPSLVNQEREGAPSRIDTPAVRAKAAAYFALPQDQRDLDQQDEWLRLLVFDQLRRAFGEDFYARMAQQVRVDRKLGAPVVPMSDTVASQQHFARTAASVAGRDLSDFFTKWGIGLTDETRAAMASLPDPSFDLTTNHDRATDRIEHAVSYTVLGVTVRADGTARYGQRSEGDSLRVHVEHAADARRGRHSLQTLSVGAGAGTAAVEVTAADGTPNAAADSFDVTRGTVVQYRGINDAVVAELVLDAASGRFWVNRVGGAARAHHHFATRYFGAEVRGADGSVLATGFLKGTETAGAFWNRFGEVAAEDGQFLVLDHLEPGNRLLRWSDDAPVPASTAKEQAFRIDGTALVPVPLSEVPGR